jgi:hypothetical protein
MMQRATLALPLVLIAGACGGSEPGVGGKTGGAAYEPQAEQAPPAVARGCPPAARHGPWTACVEAEWVSRVAEAAGYRVVDETGSALVAEGDGDSFYIWTTRHAIVPPIEKIVKEEGWEELGTASGVTIYGDERLWRWWSTDDTIFWIKAGPYETSTVPDVGELDRLVAASVRLPPPTDHPKGNRLEYDGMSIELPKGWEGRVISPGVIQAANFKFVPVGIDLPPGEEDPIKAMTAKHALLTILPACGLVSFETTARAAPKQMSLDELTFFPADHPRVPWRHALAQGSFRFGDRCVHIEVDFGATPPQPGLTKIANEMLRSLSVAER